MRAFLVEGYLASKTPAELEAVAGRARAVGVGEAIRYLGSLFLADDEVCFHVFDAPSSAALIEAGARAGLAHDRVVEIVWLPPRRDLERV